MATDNSWISSRECKRRWQRRSHAEHWKLFVRGIVLVIFQGRRRISPLSIATFAVEIIIGWLLFLSGIVRLITTFRIWRHARLLVVAVFHGA